MTPAERAAVFGAGWQTVNDGHFDTTFGGKAWGAIGDKCCQKLVILQDDDTCWRKVLNPNCCKVETRSSKQPSSTRQST